MADVQIAVVDQQNTEVTVAVPGIQGIQGQTGDVTVAQDGTAATPGIRFENDTNTGIYRPGADQLAISTNGTERLFIDASGQVGVGAAPTTRLEVARLGATWTGAAAVAGTALFVHNGNNSSSSPANIQISTGNAASGRIYFGDSDHASRGIVEYDHSDDHLHLSTNGSERARIDSSGRLLVGTSTSIDTTNFLGTTIAPGIQRAGTTNAGATIGAYLYATGANSSPLIALSRSYGTSTGSHTVIGGSGRFGAITFNGSDGTKFVSGAEIFAANDGTPGTDDMPGRLVFSTTANGSASPTERLRITSDGKVGIGTQSPANDFVVSNGGAAGFEVNPTVGVGVLYYNRSTSQYINATHDCDQFIITKSSSERVRIDSSGRLLVGTSSSLQGALPGFSNTNLYNPGVVFSGNTYQSPAWLALSQFSTSTTDSGGSFISLRKSNNATTGSHTIVNNGQRLGAIGFDGSDGTSFVNAAFIAAEVDGTPGTNDMPGRLVFSTTADGASSPTERMRITSDGQIWTGNTTSLGAAKVQSLSDSVTAAYLAHTTSTASRTHFRFINPNGEVGSITTSASATAYNTSSDYRLKENIVPVTDGITRLQQLKPSRFNFIADPDKTVDGFLAHEVQTIVPEAITGEKDAVDDEGNPVYQGIDQSKLVPLLTAALQEAIGEIESLKARVAALETP